MGSRRRRLCVLFRSIMLLMSLGFLVAVLLQTGGNRGDLSATTSATVEDSEHSGLQGSGRSLPAIKLDLVYVSKRRVPNGPDPIHNRGEGKSGRPPGRA